MYVLLLMCVYAGVCTWTALTMQCTDKGERDSALPPLLMNDLTFVLVTGKNLEGRATAQNNAALVYLSATQALVGSYWETVTLETERSKNIVIWLIPTARTAAPLQALTGNQSSVITHHSPIKSNLKGVGHNEQNPL